MPNNNSRSAAALGPEFAIETENLCKTYRASGAKGADGGTPEPALSDINLTIPRGSIFGLLGPNGAGKSTLINVLAGMVVRTSGTVRVWGFDIDRDMRGARRAIGIVPQELNVDPFFSPREALDLQAGLYGVPAAARRTDEILAAVNLSDQADAYTRTMSGGMKRRLLVAKALVHSPPVLVLDEPTAGVDVELRQHLWAYVRKLRDNGTTVLLTTHYLAEAETLCDHLAIIDHGRLIAEDSTEAMLRRLDTKQITVTLSQPIEAVPAGLERFHVERKDARTLSIQYPPSSIHSGEIIAAITEAGLVIEDLATREVELEDIFLRLTRRPNGSVA